MLGEADWARDDAEVLLRVRALGAEAGREVDAQAVVLRAVVDLRLDIDAGDAGIEGDASYDLAIDAFFGASSAVFGKTHGQRVGHADFEGMASRAGFDNANRR